MFLLLKSWSHHVVGLQVYVSSLRVGEMLGSIFLCPGGYLLHVGVEGTLYVCVFLAGYVTGNGTCCCGIAFFAGVVFLGCFLLECDLSNFGVDNTRLDGQVFAW